MSLTFYLKYLLDCPYSLQEANWYIKKNEEALTLPPFPKNAVEYKKAERQSDAGRDHRPHHAPIVDRRRLSGPDQRR